MQFIREFVTTGLLKTNENAKYKILGNNCRRASHRENKKAKIIIKNKRTYFKSINHCFFCVHWLTLLMNKSFGQHSCIKLLKDIFVIDIFKNCYWLWKFLFYFTFRNSFWRFFKKTIAIFCQLQGITKKHFSQSLLWDWIVPIITKLV